VRGWEKSFISFPYGRIPTVSTATTCLPFNLYPYMYAARYQWYESVITECRTAAQALVALPRFAYK